MLGDVECDHRCDILLYNSKVDDYYSSVANVDSFVLGVQNKRSTCYKLITKGRA